MESLWTWIADADPWLTGAMLGGLMMLAGTGAFIVIVSLTVCVTVDPNHPTRGVIRTSQEPMERLLGSMKP